MKCQHSNTDLFVFVQCKYVCTTTTTKSTRIALLYYYQHIHIGVCVCACICIVRLFIAFLCNRPGLLNIDFTQFSLLESISSIFSVHFAFLSFLCLLVFLSQMPTCMLRLSAFQFICHNLLTVGFCGNSVCANSF